MFLFFTIILLVFPPQTTYCRPGNSISNIMKRMAPNTNNYLPVSTKYFIKKNQLIKSTGIELEDDGKVRLHPDLNGTQADLFPEYPLLFTLQDIKLEIYLSSNTSTQWSSHGSAKFCIKSDCSDVVIDESSGFKGTITGISSRTLFDTLSPYFDVLVANATLSETIVSGSLIDVYDSETVISGKISLREKDDCRFSMRLTRTHEANNSESFRYFNSFLKVKFSCFGSPPASAIESFVDISFPRYPELLRIKNYSVLMQENTSLVILKYELKKRCFMMLERLKCDPNTLPVPNLTISFWLLSDRDFTKPSIEIKIGPTDTEIISKHLSELSEDLFIPFSDKLITTTLMNDLVSFNLTKTKRVVYTSDSNDLEAYFDSKSQENPCLHIGGLKICDWKGSLKMSSSDSLVPKCPEINLKGIGKAAKDLANIGMTDISIQQDCKQKYTTNYKMLLDINKPMLKKVFKSITSNMAGNDQFLKLFDLESLYDTKLSSSERESNDIEEFLSEKFPYIINGSTMVPELNSSVPFSLKLGTHPNLGVAFRNLCLYLGKISTLAFISKLTSMKEKNLPGSIEDSSLCVKNRPNISSKTNDILLNLPISVISKCFTSDILCPFLRKISGASWQGLVFEGILKETSLNLRAPINPEGEVFGRLNLSSCSVIYKLKVKKNIKIYMKCYANFSEIGYPLQIFFVPERKGQNIRIIGYINHAPKEYPTFFGNEQFRYKNLKSKFLMERVVQFLIFKVDLFYNELGVTSNLITPTAFMHLNLIDQNMSHIHIILPPLSIVEIGRIFGFGDCSDLSLLITDTLNEWEIVENGEERASQGPLVMRGLNLVQNTLFNSTIQINKKSEESKIVLHAIKPVLIPIKSINHQVTLTSYTNSREGPTLIINMECACESTCKENRLGVIVSTIKFLDMKTPIKIDITTAGPWKGEMVTNNLMGQRLKAKLFIEIASLDSEMEFTGTLLDIQGQLINRIQKSITNKATHVIDKMTYFEKELDKILLVLNKIRSEKIDTQLKLEEIKKKLEEDTVNEIVYETSLNLTCREEACERICVGCASSLSCVSKDILGSCVSYLSWDMKCGCGRDPLCLLYNDACDEIIELSKNQLKVYDEKKQNQKVLHDSYHKKLEQISKDEAKVELLYSSAMKITLKTVKEMRKKLNEARTVFKDIPISKWLRVSDFMIFSNPNNTQYKRPANMNDSNELCVYLRLKFNNRRNKMRTRNLKYCPATNGLLNMFLVTEITKELFPNIYDVSADAKYVFSQDMVDLGKNIYFERVKANRTIIPRLFNIKKNQQPHFARIRRSDSKDVILKKIIHINNEHAVNRNSLPTLNLSKHHQRGEEKITGDKWMIPHSSKGRCRVFSNVIDIINDLLNTINQIGIYQNQTLGEFKKQKELMMSNEEYYLDKLKDAGDLLGLTNSKYNESFYNILSSFSKGVSMYLQNMEESISGVERDVWSDWKNNLSGKIVKMGGKGLERFLHNLNDVIKILMKPKTHHPILGQIRKKHSDTIIRVVKGIEVLIVSEEVNKESLIDDLTQGYTETKKLKKLLKNACHL